MKKNAYKSRGGSSFRTYFHGSRKTNGCTFQRVKKAPERQASTQGKADAP